MRDGSAAGSSPDAWSADDPWQEPASDASGWGAWPSSPPPSEDELPDDAELPVSDPWAESWGDAAEPVAEPPTAPPPDRPSWTPAGPARAEPWMPIDDPWSSDVAPDLALDPDWVHTEPTAPAQPVGEPDAGSINEPASQPEPEREPEPEPEPESAPDPEPEREPEPEPEPEPGNPPESAFDSELEWSPSPWAEPATDAVPPAESAWRPEPTWPELGDSTQVLPSSWAPSAPIGPERAAGLEPDAGPIIVSRAQAEEADADVEESPSTAEQAVPWLIGVILLLAGMVIVLLALIFAGDASLGGGSIVPSGSLLAALPSASAGPSASEAATPTPTARPSASVAASAVATPTPQPVVEHGPLEMVYQGRSAALAPIYLLRHDFTTTDEPQQLAQDPNLDVRRFAWARDGSVGAGLLADVLVSIEPGKEKRRMADGISTITFGADASTLYAVRVTPDGANDVAHVLQIDFASGDSAEVAAISYARPEIGEEEALAEAAFTDDGGATRLYWVEGGTLRLWGLGAGTWQIDPSDGAVTELGPEDRPVLWSPDATRRINAALVDGSTTITLVDKAGETIASATMEGRVSHLRWAPDGERVVFTLGRAAAGGGVLQDLFLWDLNEDPPVQLTATGAAFGAEWIGTQALWRD